MPTAQHQNIIKMYASLSLLYLEADTHRRVVKATCYSYCMYSELLAVYTRFTAS